VYRSILVPLDGSAFGEHALPLARAVMRRTGASLQLLHVVPPVPVVEAGAPLLADADLMAQFRETARAYLEGVLRRLGGPTGASAPVVLEGEVVSQIQEHAARAGADLVVMATHGRGPLARFWLGGVADELVRRLPLPLLLVRPREAAADLGRGPDLGRVLLPLDGSPLAERALEPAIALGGPEATYTLLRVVKPALLPAYAPEGGRPLGREVEGLLDQIQVIQKRLLAEAEGHLAGVAGRLRERGLRVQTRVVVEEQPAVAILREAADGRAGLIALETHGRHGLSRLFLGSVADKVVRGAAVPVLVHRGLEA
jgi:nucleotide-binding universal stress UspA family protein